MEQKLKDALMRWPPIQLVETEDAAKVAREVDMMVKVIASTLREVREKDRREVVEYLEEYVYDVTNEVFDVEVDAGSIRFISNYIHGLWTEGTEVKL